MSKKKINYLLIVAGLLFVIMSIGILGVSYILYTDSVVLVEKQFIEQQNENLKEISRDIGYDINFLVRQLYFLAQRPEIKTKDIKKTSDLLAQEFKNVEKAYVNDIGVLDAQGVLLVNVTAPQIVGTNFSFREYFKRAKVSQAGSPSYEFIEFKGADIGTKGISIAMPFFSEDGNFGGVILFTIKINDFIKGFDFFHSLDSKLWAMDSDGILLYHPDYKQGTAALNLDSGSDTLKSFLQEARSLNEFKRGDYLLNGENFMIVSTGISTAGRMWTLVLEAPEKKVGDLVLSFIKKQIILVVIVLMLLIIIAFFSIYLAQAKENEEKLSALERFKGLVNLTPDCVKIIDKNRKIIYMSPGGLKEHNFKSLDEAIGWDFMDSVVDEQKESLIKAFFECISNGKSFDSIEVNHKREFANREWCSFSMIPIKDEKEEISGVLAISRDISELKKREVERLLNVKQTEEKNKRLEESEAELKKALAIAEKASNLMAGRELKMRELKEQINKLEGK